MAYPWWYWQLPPVIREGVYLFYIYVVLPVQNLADGAYKYTRTYWSWTINHLWDQVGTLQSDVNNLYWDVRDIVTPLVEQAKSELQTFIEGRISNVWADLNNLNSFRNSIDSTVRHIAGPLIEAARARLQGAVDEVGSNVNYIQNTLLPSWTNRLEAARRDLGNSINTTAVGIDRLRSDSFTAINRLTVDVAAVPETITRDINNSLAPYKPFLDDPQGAVLSWSTDIVKKGIEAIAREAIK